MSDLSSKWCPYIIKLESLSAKIESLSSKNVIREYKGWKLNEYPHKTSYCLNNPGLRSTMRKYR